MFRTLFYDDTLDDLPAGSIFLAGPTARGRRTPWRLAALEQLARLGFSRTAVIPEFREGAFDALAPVRFGLPPSPVPGMRATSYNILVWETTGIEKVSAVLFWMPFSIGDADDPASLPGFTTRAEVSRELARDASRIVLGMPSDALSGSHIRYHAHRAGVRVEETLEATVWKAATLAGAHR